jgi:hypothetical protein
VRQFRKIALRGRGDAAMMPSGAREILVEVVVMDNDVFYFDEIDTMQEEIVQYSGKTSNESETRKDEGWN